MTWLIIDIFILVVVFGYLIVILAVGFRRIEKQNEKGE